MLTVWGRADSSNVQAVMWCIGELGLPYTRHDVGHRFGGTDTPDFAALNPNRTVPVVRDGDGPALWETGAILRYLGAQYGPTLWPEDLAVRTEVDRWAEWAKVTVAAAFTVPIFWQVVRTSQAEQDPVAIKEAVKHLETKLAVADVRLGEMRHLASDAFSLADIQLGHILFRYFDIDIARADMPDLRAYYDRLTERPMYREHVMVSYDALRAT